MELRRVPAADSQGRTALLQSGAYDALQELFLPQQGYLPLWVFVCRHLAFTFCTKGQPKLEIWSANPSCSAAGSDGKVLTFPARPLRLVIRRYTDAGVPMELLECGHRQRQPWRAVRFDSQYKQLSVTIKRRCRTCKTPRPAAQL